jgi:hypothetical protein
MVSRTRLERLIKRATEKNSKWLESDVDFDVVARTARVQHATEILLQLGYDALAHDLVRLERKNAQARAEVKELGAA